MLLFLLFILSVFFVLLMGIGASILVGMCFFLGIICLLFLLLSFSIFIPPFSVAIVCAILIIMTVMFFKHRNEDTSKYYLIAAGFCIGYAVFQCITPFSGMFCADEFIIRNNEIVSVCHNDSKSFFVMLGLLVAGVIFLSLFKKDFNGDKTDKD